MLANADVGEAADWLGAVFGFTVRLRIDDHRIPMNVGDGAAVLIDLPQKERCWCASPTHRLYARVIAAEVEASAPTDHPHGERQFSAADLAGHASTFLQSIADVAPEDWGGESGKL